MAGAALTEALKVSEITSVDRLAGVFLIPPTPIPVKSRGIKITIERAGLPQGDVKPEMAAFFPVVDRNGVLVAAADAGIPDNDRLPVAVLAMEGSSDGGKTWVGEGEAQIAGGISEVRGVVQTESFVISERQDIYRDTETGKLLVLSDPYPVQYLIRGTVTFIKDCKAGVRVEALPWL